MGFWISSCSHHWLMGKERNCKISLQWKDFSEKSWFHDILLLGGVLPRHWIPLLKIRVVNQSHKLPEKSTTTKLLTLKFPFDEDHEFFGKLCIFFEVFCSRSWKIKNVIHQLYPFRVSIQDHCFKEPTTQSKLKSLPHLFDISTKAKTRTMHDAISNKRLELNCNCISRDCSSKHGTVCIPTFPDSSLNLLAKGAKTSKLTCAHATVAKAWSLRGSATNKDLFALMDFRRSFMSSHSSATPDKGVCLGLGGMGEPPTNQTSSWAHFWCLSFLCHWKRINSNVMEVDLLNRSCSYSSDFFNEGQLVCQSSVSSLNVKRLKFGITFHGCPCLPHFWSQPIVLEGPRPKKGSVAERPNGPVTKKTRTWCSRLDGDKAW